MNKRKSISETKKLWDGIEKSELSKDGFLESPEGEKWLDKNYDHNCPLCEYAWQIPICMKCPLVVQYGKQCFDLGYEEDKISTPEWFEALRGLK